MVMYITMLIYLVLAEQICYAAAADQVPRLVTACTSTSCCCEHVINAAAAHITYPHIAYMNPLVANLYRWSWGRWGGF